MKNIGLVIAAAHLGLLASTMTVRAENACQQACGVEYKACASAVNEKSYQYNRATGERRAKSDGEGAACLQRQTACWTRCAQR